MLYVYELYKYIQAHTTAENQEYIRKKALIYTKDDKRPLSEYAKKVNEAAVEICLQSPEMLANRGELFQAAQAKVREAYNFKRGYSR